MLGKVGTHIGNNPNVGTEAGWEASGGVFGIGEVFEASRVETQLHMLEIQCQLKDSFILGTVDWWQCVLTFFEWVTKCQGEQPQNQCCVREEHAGCGVRRRRVGLAR